MKNNRHAILYTVLSWTIPFGLCLNVPKLDQVVEPGNVSTNSHVSRHPLVHIGDVDGKSYYYDTATSLNFTQARAHCNAGGLSLATIRNIEQLTFLQNAYTAGLLPLKWYWTAARESRKFSMFNWDQTDDELPSIIYGYPNTGFPVEYQFCLMYQSSDGNLHGVECKTSLNGYPLCET